MNQIFMFILIGIMLKIGKWKDWEAAVHSCFITSLAKSFIVTFTKNTHSCICSEYKFLRRRYPFKHQPLKMVKHPETIQGCRLKG